MGRVSDFLPIMAQMGSFKRHYVPPRVGEQVMVLCPFGNANMGYILRGIYHNDSEPITHSEKDMDTEYIEYEDGTKIELSLEDQRMKIDTPMEISIKTEKTLDHYGSEYNTR